jgi:hypothetical protein
MSFKSCLNYMGVILVYAFILPQKTNYYVFKKSNKVPGSGGMYAICC